MDIIKSHIHSHTIGYGRNHSFFLTASKRHFRHFESLAGIMLLSWWNKCDTIQVRSTVRPPGKGFLWVTREGGHDLCLDMFEILCASGLRVFLFVWSEGLCPQVTAIFFPCCTHKNMCVERQCMGQCLDSARTVQNGSNPLYYDGQTAFPPYLFNLGT